MNPVSSLAESNTSPAGRRRKKYVAEIIAVIVILSTLAILLIPAVRKQIEFQHYTTCKENLKQIVLALQQYHEAYESYPPAYTVGPDGRRLHSWRSLILPFLGQEDLHAQIRWDEPWNSPHNKRVAEQNLEVYTCPASKGSKPARANFFAIVDRATAWPEQYSSKLTDIHDGPANTILVIEAGLRDVNWMEPRDVSRTEAADWVGAHGAQCGFCSGSVRQLTSIIDRKVFMALTSINGGAAYSGIDWPPLLSSNTKVGPPRPASELKSTDIWPVTDYEISPHRNLVYCCSYQLAWDYARRSANVTAIELEGDPVLARQLNASSFLVTDLSDTAYVAIAGAGTDAVPIIQLQLQQKFPGFKTELQKGADVREFVAYAYLRKILPFAVSFDRLQDVLVFNSRKVESFGVKEFDNDDVRHGQLASQIQILDYVSDDDFVVRLTTRDRSDEIVLAKIEPGPTLAETLARVHQRASKPPLPGSQPNPVPGESFVVPVLSVDVQREFDELSGRSFNMPEFNGLYIGQTWQVIRLRLDENGARVESEALVIGDDEPPPGKSRKPRHFVFDKPFLIWFREKQASAPYLVAWVANADLMEMYHK